MAKWCEVCRTQYVLRCKREKQHHVIAEWFAQRDAVSAVKDLLCESIDEARLLERKWRPRSKRKRKRTTQTLTLRA
jgi:hypothetical protein